MRDAELEQRMNTVNTRAAIYLAVPDVGHVSGFRSCPQVTVRDAELEQRVRVVNSGAEELSFTGALHSYFRVGGITQVGAFLTCCRRSF